MNCSLETWDWDKDLLRNKAKDGSLYLFHINHPNSMRLFGLAGGITITLDNCLKYIVAIINEAIEPNEVLGVEKVLLVVARGVFQILAWKLLDEHACHILQLKLAWCKWIKGWQSAEMSQNFSHSWFKFKTTRKSSKGNVLVQLIVMLKICASIVYMRVSHLSVISSTPYILVVIIFVPPPHRPTRARGLIFRVW